jgi:hypothetical protein
MNKLFIKENVEESVMKTILSLIVSSLLTLSAFAGSITISFNSNKSFEALVDGRTYSSGDYNSMNGSGNQLVLNNLSAGQHTVQIYRLNANNKRNKQVYSSTFYLNVNQNIHLTVSGNGTISREETSSNDAYGGYNNTYRTPMSTASYNSIYSGIRGQWTQSRKVSAARDAFNNTSYYFTATQARQILQLISSEANRLELAKLSYDNIADPANFSTLYDLFNTQSRNDLDYYIRNTYSDPYNNNNSGSTYNNYRTPMTDANFNTVYQSIRSKWLPGGKMSAATSAFNNTSYYFTTTQVRQIIALLSSESNRLDLAKLSYDNITDPQNFTQLYDLFSSQSSRDELDAYVRDNYNRGY